MSRKFVVVFMASEREKFDQVLGMVTGSLGNEDLADAILVVWHEQLANIVEHSYQQVDKQVVLGILVSWNEVVLTIMDSGEAWIQDGYFDYPGAERKLRLLAEHEAERGRGLPITALLTDSVRFYKGGRIRELAWHWRCCRKST